VTTRPVNAPAARSWGNQSISYPDAINAARHTGQVDAQPDPENDGEAATGPAPNEAHALDTSTTKNGPPVADVKTTSDPESPPRALTRRYPDVSDDDRDVGWGERPASSGRDDDWYLRERPPHHG
jgi:hypothetical protein